MKKIFFLFAMLASVAVGAQIIVQITPVSATYTSTPTIQLEVSWTNQSTDNHRNKVWIFVDFQPVISPSQKGNWQPATITGTVQTTAGAVSGQSNRGFFLEGTTTNFSSMVTVQLSNTGTSFNWCAYGSDYPPNILDYVGGIYTLRGTPPFTLKDANGNTQIVTGTTIAQSSLTITPITMTDKTGCPGYFCKYVGMDLHMNVSYPCQQRTSGAQNWEAYVLDARDSKIYRIVQMPDDKWYFAQDLDYRNGTDNAYHASYCSTYIYGQTAANSGTVCPSGWDVPTSAIWTQLKTALDGDQSCWRAFWPISGGGTDEYGFATETTCAHSQLQNYQWLKLGVGSASTWLAYGVKSATCLHMLADRSQQYCQIACFTRATPAYTPIRCVRQL